MGGEGCIRGTAGGRAGQQRDRVKSVGPRHGATWVGRSRRVGSARSSTACVVRRGDIISKRAAAGEPWRRGQRPGLRGPARRRVADGGASRSVPGGGAPGLGSAAGTDRVPPRRAPRGGPAPDPYRPASQPAARGSQPPFVDRARRARSPNGTTRAAYGRDRGAVSRGREASASTPCPRSTWPANETRTVERLPHEARRAPRRAAGGGTSGGSPTTTSSTRGRAGLTTPARPGQLVD